MLCWAPAGGIQGIIIAPHAINQWQSENQARSLLTGSGIEGLDGETKDGLHKKKNDGRRKKKGSSPPE
jgi:hypothetical protein